MSKNNQKKKTNDKECTSEIKVVPLADLIPPSEKYRARRKNDPKHVEKVLTMLKDGETFNLKPKVTPADGQKKKLELLTCNHYVAALKEFGTKKIEVEIVRGSEEALYKMAVEDNARHGKSYDRDDLHENIRTLKRKYKMSYRDIATIVGCGKSLVGNVCSGDLNGFAQKSIKFLKDQILEADAKTVATLVDFVCKVKDILDTHEQGDDFVQHLSGLWDLRVKELEEETEEEPDDDFEDDDDEGPLTDSLDDDEDFEDDDEEYVDDDGDFEDEEDFGDNEDDDEWSDDDDDA